MKEINTFKSFSIEEHLVWKILCDKRFVSSTGQISELHKRGWDLLGMNSEKIPDFKAINEKLFTLTGWQVSTAKAQYEEDSAWLSSLERKTLLITEYIRGLDSLDYTPLPDVFHDAFGHIPFLAIPEYARIAHAFGNAFNKATTKDEKLRVANNWWYGIEFSFIKEDGKLKALGTGLVSSEGELKNALSGKVEILPYNWEQVAKIDRSAHEYHKTLFVLDSLKQLEDELNKRI